MKAQRACLTASPIRRLSQRVQKYEKKKVAEAKKVKKTPVKKSLKGSKGSKGKKAQIKKIDRGRKVATKLTKAVLAAKEPMDRIYDPKFEGNDDDMGSVDSGALDENICFECGVDTNLYKPNSSPERNVDTIVICDVCSGEYHLTCAKFDRNSRPSTKWTCPRCAIDEEFFEKMKYDIVIKNWDGKKQRVEFKIVKPRNGEKPGYCFSPSRPLMLAWEECLAKGFMSVSKVFDYKTIKLLTHGEVEIKTLTGRVASKWFGALHQISEQVRLGVMTNLINRGGRYDLRLPDDLVHELRLDDMLKPILDKLRTIMGPHPTVRTHNVVFAPVGSECQKWHFDDTKTQLKKQRYFTILIPLNLIDENAGGTELWSRLLKRGDMVRNDMNAYF